MYYISCMCACVFTQKEVLLLKLFTEMHLKQTGRSLKLIINENGVNKVFSGNTRNQYILNDYTGC